MLRLCPGEESATTELIPLHFVGSIVDILTRKLYRRISVDIYRGIVLEAAQRIVTEHLLPMVENC